MGRQAIEKAIESLHERKSDPFELLSVSVVSPINSTLTNFADHCKQFSHDATNRYLGGEKITPRLVWDNVQGQSVPMPRGFISFDDTVPDTNYPLAIELVRSQYSGNTKAVIKGISVVSCV